MPIDWISVKKRVPENRRDVLIWGHGTVAFKTPQFLGVDRYNPGHRFDREIRNSVLSPGWKVTHWAELNAPSSD